MSGYTISLSGLNFATNNGYKPNAYMAAVDLFAGYSNVENLYNINTFTFSKQNTATLQIELKDVNTDTLEANQYNTIVGNINFVFQITPKRKSALKLYPVIVNMPLANLTLKSTDINASTTLGDYFGATINNNVGIIKSNRWSYTWKNVSIKDIVGIENWNKYKKFNIGLVQLAIGNGGDNASDAYFSFMVELKGLPFTSSYNVKTRSSSGANVVTTFQYVFNGNAQLINNNIQYFTFNKIESADIMIDIKSVNTDTYFSSDDETEIIGHTNWLFQIIPVEDDY
jgi:hypothetical protein